MPRPRALKPRIDQVEGRRTAAAGATDGAAARGRRLLRAEAAIGMVIRHALNSAGADVSAAGRLAVADDAAAALAAIPDTPELRDADRAAAPPLGPHQRHQADAFTAKISAMTKDFASGRPLDLAQASLAELFAWSLAQSRPPATAGGEKTRCAEQAAEFHEGVDDQDTPGLSSDRLSLAQPGGGHDASS
jgi:hypothetical protein